MTKKKNLSPAEQERKEQEALASIINIDGHGEHPAVQALMSPEFERMTNMDASQIALMLQQLVRGQNSMLEQNSTQIAKLLERQDQIDRRLADELETNRKFIEEVLERAESLKRTGIEQDKLIANGMIAYQKAKESAVANLVMKNLAFEETLATQPKVTVVSSGVLITTMEHGQQIAKIIPEEIRIRNKTWILPIGRAIEVPQVVAEVMAQRRASQVETSKRRELLERNLESSKLAEAWNKIEGSKSEPMTI